MRAIHARDINEAFYLGLMHVHSEGVAVTRRGKSTLEPPWPVATVYEKPMDRVLFNRTRDCNPFFHLMEAIWILQGRDDVAFLELFNARMALYSDNGKTFHAPYGHRLRHTNGDQIAQAIELFKADIYTRQVVLQIWDAQRDLGAKTKDMPCNDFIMFKVRDGHHGGTADNPEPSLMLDMTVCCRSNDAIWGAYGANVVQFSFLQEYIARSIGVSVGMYTQLSDSFHVYTNEDEGQMWRRFVDETGTLSNHYHTITYGVEAPVYGRITGETGPFCSIHSDSLLRPYETMDKWNEDLARFFTLFDQMGPKGLWRILNDGYAFQTNFFNDLVAPFYSTWVGRKLGMSVTVDNSHKHYLLSDHERVTQSVSFPDWKIAAVEWLERREE